MNAEESIKTHTEFDDIFAKKNPELIKRFEVSGYTNLTLYLICEEGYMQAGQIGGYKGLIYNSAKVTKAQRIIKEKFEKMGYDVEGLAPEAEVDER